MFVCRELAADMKWFGIIQNTEVFHGQNVGFVFKEHSLISVFIYGKI
jgi:hypothetical protein